MRKSEQETKKEVPYQRRTEKETTRERKLFILGENRDLTNPENKEPKTTLNTLVYLSDAKRLLPGRSEDEKKR